MNEYQIYSDDIWDYLGNMPYMPSRADRDQLVQNGDLKRVQIWDYFFRIRPEDLGKPQKKEIADIEIRLIEEIAKYNKRRKEIENSIDGCRKALFWKRLKAFLYGFGGFLVAIVIFKISTENDFNFRWITICISPFLIYGFVMWISVAFIGWDERREIRESIFESFQLSRNHEQKVKGEIERKNTLRDEIKALKRKIPLYPSNGQVRNWLDIDFRMLWERSQEVTALSNRLVPIESDDVDENGNPKMYNNPFAILGPAELQQPGKIPPTFSEAINPDLKKHLSARRSSTVIISGVDQIEVLYGVYYLEHVLIADDMLGTYGLFFDFITGKFYAEQITEQYYNDVVAILMTTEFRTLHLDKEQGDVVYIEDAPTFTMSLASGENRTVTFVSEDYFMEIREKINLNENEVSRIYWVNNSKKDAEKAIKALRSQLRLHKGDEN